MLTSVQGHGWPACARSASHWISLNLSSVRTNTDGQSQSHLCNSWRLLLRLMCRWKETQRKPASISQKKCRLTRECESSLYQKNKQTAVRPKITAGFWQVKRRIQHVFAFYSNNRIDYYDLLPTSVIVFKPLQLLTALKTVTAPTVVLDINIRLIAALLFIRTITQTYSNERSHVMKMFSGLDTGPQHLWFQSPQKFFVASLSPWIPVVARQMLLSNEGRKHWGMLVHLSVHLFRPDRNNPQFFQGFTDIF